MANIDCYSVKDKSFTVYRHLTLAKHYFMMGKPERAREHLSQLASVLSAMKRDADGDKDIVNQITELQKEVSKLINFTQALAYFKHYAPQELSALSKGEWVPQEVRETRGGTYTRYTSEYHYIGDPEPEKQQPTPELSSLLELTKLLEQTPSPPQQPSQKPPPPPKKEKVIETDPFGNFERQYRQLVNKVFKACPVD